MLQLLLSSACRASGHFLTVLLPHQQVGWAAWELRGSAAGVAGLG